MQTKHTRKKSHSTKTTAVTAATTADTYVYYSSASMEERGLKVKTAAHSRFISLATGLERFPLIVSLSVRCYLLMNLRFKRQLWKENTFRQLL